MKSTGERTTKDVIVSYALTSFFCLAIAILLNLLGMVQKFSSTLTISFSIGLSINTAFILLSARLRQWESWYIAPIVITLIGLGIGLAIAGVLVIGDAWFFFSSDYSSLITGIFFGVVGFLIFNTREQLLHTRMQLAEADAARIAQERRTLETELKLLQAQIEPHFLFNTLGNIASLIRNNPQGAETTLQNLSRLLRASLKRTRHETNTLAEEIEIVTAYLDIQKVRMGERLEVAVIVPGHLRSMPLPPLLLQPLVENAVIHGLDPKLEGGRVGIDAAVEEDRIVIRVTDTGLGFRTVSSGSGVGLRNVRERLAALYGTAASLELLENPAGGITAELRLPVPQP
jgi:sensor histidine kinase YesM